MAYLAAHIRDPYFLASGADVRIIQVLLRRATLRRDSVGVAALADLDLGDHVQISLRLTSATLAAGIAPGAGDRERHVGFELPAEIDPAQ